MPVLVTSSDGAPPASFPQVDGMVCDGCSSRVEEALAKMAGVKKVRQRGWPHPATPALSRCLPQQ